MEKAVKQVPVVVTTKHRGVFFGTVDEAKLKNKSLTLARCRNAIYWVSKVNGFLGLASDGPNKDCRIGAEAPEVLLHDVTSVSLCTETAAAAWASHGR